MLEIILPILYVLLLVWFISCMETIKRNGKISKDTLIKILKEMKREG